MELSMYQFSIFFSNNCQSKDFQNQHCTCCMGIGTLSVAVFLCIISRQGKLPLVTVIFQHLAFKVKHFIPKPISIDKKKLGTSHFSVAGKQKFPSQQISQCPRACELAFVKAQREGERRLQRGVETTTQPASLTFLLSCSCSCCRRQILGLLVESSSSSFPQPSLFLYFSGQCSVAFYPRFLQRQKTKEVIVLSSPSRNKCISQALRFSDGKKKKKTA